MGELSSSCPSLPSVLGSSSSSSSLSRLDESG